MKRLRSVGLLAVIVVAVGTVLPRSAAGQEDTWALVNARIVTVSGATIERGTVVIRDGLIAGVGTDLAVPPDARVLDLSGKTVYPGMIDLASTVALEQRERPQQTRFQALPTAQRDTTGWQGLDPERMVADELQSAHRSVREWRDAGVGAALVAPTAGTFRGQSALINLRGGSPGEMILISPAALHMGFQGVRSGYPRTLMGVMAYQRQSLLDARYLALQRDRYDANPRGMQRPAAGPHTTALASYAVGDGMVVIDARSERAIRRAVGLANEFGLDYVLSSVGEGWLALELLVSERRPVLVSLALAAPDSITGRSFLYTRPEPPPSDSALQWLIDHNAAALDSAGISFALTSGGGAVEAADFRGAVRRTIRAGLAPAVALRAVTVVPAEIMGIADRLGSIEPGKIANLIVATGDLFADSTKLEAVFVDGERFVVPPDDDRPSRRRGGEGSRGSGEHAAGEATEDEAAAEQAAEATGPFTPPAIPIPPSTIPRGQLVAVTNATILTAANGTIEGGTILIRDGKIVEIGSDVRVPRNAEVIDASGKYVIPGIVDSHSHMAIEGGINEGTDNLTPQVRIADEIEHDDIQLWRALAGGVTTIHVLHGSANSIGGQDAVIKLRWGLRPDQLFVEDAPRGIKFALGENPKRSNRSSIPGAPRRFPSTRMGVEYSIAEAFQRARAYQQEWAEYDRLRGRTRRDRVPPRRDLFLETLVGILDGTIRVHSHSYRADEILMLINLADSLGFTIGTFQHVLEGYKVADEIAAHGAGASTFADSWAYKLEAFDAIPYNAALMHRRGVRVSINSDSGERVRRMLQEAAKAMKYGGVSEQDALRMVTLNPAIDIGLGDRIGSLEPGKDADLVIMTHHPFDPRSRVDKTMIDGVIYFDYDVAPKLRDRIEQDAEPITSDGGAR